jgi:hypothetical protein
MSIVGKANRFLSVLRLPFGGTVEASHIIGSVCQNVRTCIFCRCTFARGKAKVKCPKSMLKIKDVYSYYRK